MGPHCYPGGSCPPTGCVDPSGGSLAGVLAALAAAIECLSTTAEGFPESIAATTEGFPESIAATTEGFPESIADNLRKFHLGPLGAAMAAGADADALTKAIRPRCAQAGYKNAGEISEGALSKPYSQHLSAASSLAASSLEVES